MTLPRRLLCLLSLALPAAPAPAQHGEGPPPTPVYVTPIAREELQEYRRVTGELRARARSSVATIEPALVLEVPAVEGDRLAEGDLIAVLDGRRLEIEMRRLAARATVLAAEVAAWEGELAMKANDLAALRVVAAKGSSNPKELADAESEVRIAEARLDGAKMALDVLRAETDLVATRLEDMRIRAPFAGAVVRIDVEPGEWVAEGEAIAELVSVDTYEAWLDVPQRLAAALAPAGGAAAPVRVDLDAPARTIGQGPPVVVPLVDRNARTFSIYVRVTDESGALASGMSVTGWVPTAERGAYLTVPRDAVLRNQAGYYVFVARSPGGGPALATPVPVSIAFETGERIAVRDGSGLREGDEVVVEGNERLFPMMPVRAIPAGTKAATKAASGPARGGGAGDPVAAGGGR